MIFISSSEITPSGLANQDAQEALNLVYFIYIYNTRGCVNVKNESRFEITQGKRWEDCMNTSLNPEGLG